MIILETLIYLFFLTPTFFAFFLMFQCMLEQDETWEK